MQIHHQKHHAAYVANLNVAEEKLEEAKAKSGIDLEDLFIFKFYDSFFYIDCVSSAISVMPSLKFNGGGHLNHTIFWKILCPKGSSEPSGRDFYLKKKYFHN